MHSAISETAQSLLEKDKAHVWHPFSPAEGGLPNIPIVKGEGAWLIAEDGSRYLDLVSSWWVNLHGHAHPYIAQKVSEQLHTLEHVIFAGFTHAPAVELAERLLPLLPGDMNKAFFTDNGSTATEVALKIAIQYFHNRGEKRRRILAFEDAYHGDTFGAMSVGGRGSFSLPFDPYLFEVDLIPYPTPGQEQDTLQVLEAALAKEGDFAAFIFEPLIQGTAGMRMCTPKALDQVLSRCRRAGILLIADEVMTGFGRTGTLFACEQLTVQPDLICLSKGITGGTIPLGLTAVTATIFEAFRTPDRSRMLAHGHSFTANPLACTAALASLDLLLKPECTQARADIEAQHNAFKEGIKGHSALADVRQSGTILALEIKTEAGGYFSHLRDYFYTFFLEHGLLMRPLGNILYLIPPYCITRQQLELAYATLKQLLDKFPFSESNT